jgi:hypothetical protein
MAEERQEERMRGRERQGREMQGAGFGLGVRARPGRSLGPTGIFSIRSSVSHPDIT